MISNFLNGLRGGRTVIELEEAIREVSREVAETGRAGSITLSITIEPGGASRFVVKDKIGSKVPEHNRESSIFFQLENGDLSRNDPRQVSLSLIQDMEQK